MDWRDDPTLLIDILADLESPAMTMPTPQEARSRQTAYEATEHWWKSRLEALVEKWRQDAFAEGRVSFNADELERLIRERTR